MSLHTQENCRILLDSLSDYVDGELGEEICNEINRHLAGCHNCQIVVDTLKRTIYLYHAGSEAPTVPEDVRERLYHCLDLDEFLEK